MFLSLFRLGPSITRICTYIRDPTLYKLPSTEYVLKEKGVCSKMTTFSTLGAVEAAMKGRRTVAILP